MWLILSGLLQSGYCNAASVDTFTLCVEVKGKVVGSHGAGGLFGSVLTTQTFAARGQSVGLPTTDYTPAVRRSLLRMLGIRCASDFGRRTEFDTIGCSG